MGCKVKELRFGLHKCRTPGNVLHRKYLLSVISLSHYSMRKVMCQYKIQFIFVKKNKK